MRSPGHQIETRSGDGRPSSHSLRSGDGSWRLFAWCDSGNGRFDLGRSIVGRRVLHVFQPLEGGVPAYVLDLTTILRARGWDITVACDAANDVTPLLTARGVRSASFVADRNPSLRDGAALRLLAEIVRRQRPDLIHAHSSKAGLLAGVVGRALRVPSIYTPHGWSFQMEGSITAKAFLAAAEGLVARRAHRLIVAVCKSEREQALKWHVAHPASLAVVHTGRRVITGRPIRSELRGRLGLDPSDTSLVVAWIGRIGRQKGAENLPTIADRLAAGGVRLATMGSGLDEAGISAAVEAAGGIAVPKGISPSQLLAASDALVSTSAWEGLPLVVLEALEQALPVIAYDVGGLPEQVLEGRNGFLVPPGAEHILLERINSIAQSPEIADRFGRASREIWLERFQPEMMVDRMELIYEHILGNR